MPRSKSNKTRDLPSEIVVNDDFSHVSPRDGKTYKMTMKEKAFCEEYVSMYGNGVEAIIEAGYDVWKKDKDGNKLYPNRKLAAVMAYENLSKPHICSYVDSLLEEHGFNDDNVSKQHLFLLNQHSDYKSKAKAVDMFYQLKGKYAPVKSTSVNLNLDVEAKDPVIDKLREEFNEKARLIVTGKQIGRAHV